jgi:hypothetical protein
VRESGRKEPSDGNERAMAVVPYRVGRFHADTIDTMQNPPGDALIQRKHDGQTRPSGPRFSY